MKAITAVTKHNARRGGGYKTKDHYVSFSFKNLRCASIFVFEALHMKGVRLLSQIGGEGDFKLCETRHTAEDKVHSGQRKRKDPEGIC